MRLLAVVPVLLLLLASAPGSAVPSGSFGAAGDPAFSEHLVPMPSGVPVVGLGAGRAAEPTIGIPWDTDHVFYHAGSRTVRGDFSGVDPTWTDVSPPYQSPTNLDPMLDVNPDTGRIYAGGLAGACSVMMMSDDDGATWVPAGNMCSGARFDHQSIGSGPAVLPVANPTHPHAAYYCGQFDAIACNFSPDGGESWGPFRDVPGPCGGFHGHIRVSRTTGFVAVPVGACGGDVGFISTADGGITWVSNAIPDTQEWTNGFDPSIQFTRPSGWMYYAMAWEHGVYVALSKDEGQTWEPLGGGMPGVEETHWLDIGRLADPPVVAGTFTNVQAGDDDRVAITFLGLEGGPGADLDVLTSNAIYRCDQKQEELVWYYYAAFSYDAGETWSVRKISDLPVQVGGIYDSVVDGGGGCRNLLDFNDSDIDSTGRLYVGWADGCVDECDETRTTNTTGYRAQVGKVFRQETGRGLFASFDTGEGEPNNTTEEPERGSGGDTPGVGAVAGFLALAVVLGLARRRTR